MTQYYNINTKEKSRKPTSKRTSNLWLNDEKLKEEGWYPIQDVTPAKNRSQKYGDEKFTFNETDEVVEKTRPVEDKLLADFKEEVIRELRMNAESRIAEIEDPFLQRFDPRTASNSSGIKAVVDEYKARKADVEAASTLGEVDAVSVDFSEV